MPTVSTRTRKHPLFVALAVGIISVAVLAALSIGSGDAADGKTPEASGPLAPATAFEFFDGTPATLASYAGKPLVVNFWASWCPSCVAELSAAFRPVQDRLGNDVSFLGMNIQDERDRALALVEESGVRFDLAEDRNGDLYSELGGLGMPFTVLVSTDGEILHTHNGPLTESQLEDLIVEFLLS